MKSLFTEDGEPSNYEAEEIMGRYISNQFFELKNDAVEIIVHG